MAPQPHRAVATSNSWGHRRAKPLYFGDRQEWAQALTQRAQGHIFFLTKELFCRVLMLSLGTSGWETVTLNLLQSPSSVSGLREGPVPGA